MRSVLLAGVSVAALAVLAAGCGSTKTVIVTHTVTTVKTVTTTKTTTVIRPAGGSACSGADLQASFTAIAGSAGAGQTSYELLLTNTSTSSCSVSGLPVATLLDKNGAALPTQVSAEPPAQAATAVVLQHGDAAKADARFSPDVMGTGDSQVPGPCQPTAYVLRVTAQGGGSVNAPISPPTSVCEAGSLHFSVFTSAG